MAIDKKIWLNARGYYEAGLSLSQIKEKTGIARNTISQRAKKEHWEHSSNSEYIEAKTKVLEQKGTILEQKGTVSLTIADTIAIDRASITIFFNNSAIQNQKVANKGMDNLSRMIEEQEEENEGKSILSTTCMGIVKDHSIITKTNKETVLGKDIIETPKEEDEILDIVIE